eukprot:TRINITY_DN4549_c0_g1_i1.p1 TRINITY_DN4549_c0_g1~~TRINITY_DN4549_c0_g1_i1.p1  ORF type:complete len:186 (+),score=21.34 TRINITY_DN4549_c0_g1_i1:80-559(+)
MSKIECAICFEQYQQSGTRMPYLLQCGHTYCKSDLEEIASKGDLECPECRRTSADNEYAKAMFPNYALIRILKEESSCGTWQQKVQQELRSFCSQPAPAVRQRAPSSEQEVICSEWSCTICTFENSNASSSCSMCGASPGGASRRTISRADVLMEVARS